MQRQSGWLTVFSRGLSCSLCLAAAASGDCPGKTWTTFCSGQLGGVTLPNNSASCFCKFVCGASFSNLVERRGRPTSGAKQTCSSSPVRGVWNRVTQIWMETIANISQQGTFNRGSQRGVLLTVNDFDSFEFVSSVPKM